MTAFAEADFDYNDHGLAMEVTDVGPRGTITGLIWDDIGDTANLHDGLDNGINGVAVDLYSAGQFVRTAFTDHNGAFTFSRVSPGSYQVFLRGIDGMNPVVKGPTNDPNSSNFNPDRWSDVIPLADGQVVQKNGGAKEQPGALGIQSVKWVQKTGNKGALVNPDGIDNPNIGRGDRVFPEIKVEKPTTANGNKVKVGTEVADEVELKVTLTSKTADVDVRVRFVDVDDPVGERGGAPRWRTNVGS